MSAATVSSARFEVIRAFAVGTDMWVTGGGSTDLRLKSIRPQS